MSGNEVHARLLALSRPRGSERRYLRLAERIVLFEGLDRALATALERRWGGFLRSDSPADPIYRVRVFSAGSAGWLSARPGEPYRMEALRDARRRVVASHNFALCEEGGSGSWRLGMTDDSAEPAERMMDNASRFLAARLALERGGFAMHAAGVLHEGRAFIFAGPSRSGKSTAVRLSAGSRSLGDDFAVVVPDPAGWSAPASPFDNSERIEANPPAGMFPLAGVWRLYKAAETRVQRPTRGAAVASLMGCVAFPWALPEQTETLLARCEKLVSEGRFAHLLFTRDGDIWAELLR
jgi:hypothetical protein